jgi:uncharacterized protein
MFQPGEVDPLRFCRSAQVWQAESDTSAFPRLAHEFTQGRLSCRVAGEVDAQQRLALRVTIRGEVVLTCQRCLNDLPFEVELERRVYLARDAGELERLEQSLGPEGEAILAGGKLNLVDLVEDEVLLGLPLVPMHEPGECPETVS